MVVLLLCAVTSVSCNSQQKQTQAAGTRVAADGPRVEKVKDDISGLVRELYTVVAKKEDTRRFACHTWWDTVEAVDRKDAEVEEIGFFNDDLWTQMQDGIPDEFEVRDIVFQQIDVEKGTALIDFVLWSPVQTIRQKFEFCREDGDWRVHNIIRCHDDAEGPEAETDMMKEMLSYLSGSQDDTSALTYANMEGIYDSLDEDMNSESRFVLNADGTASWGMIGSLHFTEYTYTISGHTICLKPKDVDTEEDCYEYDEDTRSLKNEQGAVYYRQIPD